jgi:prepilin peptidase CpaA
VSGVIPPRGALGVPRLGTLPLRGFSREGLAFAASGAVAGMLWFSADAGTLPAALGTTAFLSAAAWWDVRALRIPNALTAPALAGVLLWAGITGGWGAVGSSLLAAAIAVALLFGPFAWGCLGAGDVKALAVLAALWGLEAFLPALWWMLVAGGAGALVVITAQGELGDLLRRWGRSLWLSLASRRLHYVSAAPGSAARAGLPFAVAMGLGSAAYALWGAPL